MAPLIAHLAATVLAVTFVGCALPTAGQRVPDPLDVDVSQLPTPHAVVDAMLRLAGVGAGDVLYDLGAGDGRIVIAAARSYGIRAVGIELDARKAAEARANVERAGLAGRVEIRHGDAFDADLREASVVTLFLFPEINERLAPKLRAELRPGARIVSHRFGLGDWPPERRVEVHRHPLMLWILR